MPKSPDRTFSMSFRDDSEEAASALFHILGGATVPQVAALSDSAEALSSMLLKTITDGVTDQVSTLAGTGRRELRLLVRYHDNANGDKFTMSIPGVAAGVVTLPDSDFLDPANALYVAFKTAFETIVVTKYTNNPVTLDSIELTRGQK